MVSFSILSLWRMVVIVGRLDRITNGKWCELCGVFVCVWFQFDSRRKWVAGRRLTSLHPSARRLYRWTPSSTAHSVTTRSHAKSNCRSSIWIMKQKTIFSFFSSSFPVTLFFPLSFCFNYRYLLYMNYDNDCYYCYNFLTMVSSLFLSWIFSFDFVLMLTFKLFHHCHAHKS